MDAKLDKLMEDVNEIKLDLREHMYRTELLEKAVTPMFSTYTAIKWVITGILAAVSVYSVILKFLT